MTRRLSRSVEEMKRRLERAHGELVKKVEALAREREEMLAVLTSMIEGVLVIDAAERVVLANAACARMFEWAEEMKGRPFWEGMRHRELLEILRRSLRQGTVEDTELSIFLPEEKILQAQISPLRRGGGQVGVVCVFHDITTLRKLERHRREFVANASHELKTPLTSIKGFVETLLGGALAEQETAERFLRIIAEHTAKLERLIEEMLELARLETKEIPLHLERIDLERLIRRIEQLFSGKIRARGQIFEAKVAEGTSLVGDEDRLEQALANLVDNAVKFTPREGKITVTAAEDTDRVLIAVSDTGIGIAEENLPRIFERFYRVDKSRSREAGGAGLGLSIVKHVIQAHQGEIAVASAPGRGSTFTMSLPKQGPEIHGDQSLFDSARTTARP
jgi:two-component system phosphate regulon sensor histidine kinase PhoR